MTRTIDPADPVIPTTGREEAAYREGRADEHSRVDPATTVGALGSAAYREGRADERAGKDRGSASATKDAYAQGRRDALSRRRGSPLLTLLLLIVVAAGAVLIYLAIQNGSFSSGGKVVDQNLSNAAETVKAPLRGAADKAGTALQNAGSDLKQDAGGGNQ